MVRSRAGVAHRQRGSGQRDLLRGRQATGRGGDWTLVVGSPVVERPHSFDSWLNWKPVVRIREGQGPGMGPEQRMDTGG
jgi:hypothetical protein